MPVIVDKSSINLFGIAERIAQTDATVMITGETGAGKEILARYIHKMSDRCDKAFVAINCAAIPENLLESELFGHEKGAYTGAFQRRLGKFEEASHGTILLDEISEMPLLLQAKLLRVLQEKEFSRLGSNEKITVDVRIIATSNRDLEKAVAEKTFREDLYYRLNVIPLQIPALRDRKMDIIPLAIYFCKKYSGSAKTISKDLLNRLKEREWRGNVRELENFVHRAVILSQKDVIEVGDIFWEKWEIFSGERDNGASDTSANPKNDAGEGRSDAIDEATNKREDGSSCEHNLPNSHSIMEFKSLSETLSQIEKEAILAALKEFKGNKSLVAKKLGIPPRTLRYKLKAYMAEENSSGSDNGNDRESGNNKEENAKEGEQKKAAKAEKYGKIA